MKTYDTAQFTPRTLHKLAQLQESDRKAYASELLTSYSAKAADLENKGQKLAADWVINQGRFLAGLCRKLEQIIDTGEMPEE